MFMSTPAVPLSIRELRTGDWPGVWAVLEPVFRAGETYALARDISEAEARSFWVGAPNEVFVAVAEGPTRIVGTYFMRPNGGGSGGHVCNCGFAVAAAESGRGVASAMCDDALRRARATGFRAMQFNFVVSTNERAVQLWQRKGFAVVGRLPGAFGHPSRGLVDALVMHRWLDPVEVGEGERGAAIVRSAVPTFLVANVAETARWYVDNLGFRAVGLVPLLPPHVYGSLQLGAAEIMLLALEGYEKPDLRARRPAGLWDAYVRADGVRRLYESVAGRPFVQTELTHQPYGDWEFEVRDPNGYTLVFGGAP